MASDSKVVLLTGGSSGIGLATARLLMWHGYRVYSCSRRMADSQDYPASGGMICPLSMDVTDTASVQAAVDEVVRREGRIDVLVSNAGNGVAGAVEETSDADVRLQMDTNFMGCVNVVRAVLPVMRRQHSGRIVATSSVAAIVPIPFQAFYSASKAAILVYMQALSMEVKPFGIECCAVLPGDVSTGFTKARRYTEASLDAASPYGEAMHKAVSTMEHDEMNGMKPEEIAHAVLRQLSARRMSPVETVGWQYKLDVFLMGIVPVRLRLWIISKLYG